MRSLLSTRRAKRLLAVSVAIAGLGNAAFVLDLGAAPVKAGQCCRQHANCDSSELCLPELSCAESPFPGWTHECGKRSEEMNLF